jgi:hypothetical protein
MTNRTRFSSVANGDRLYEGYFNDIHFGIGSLTHLVDYDRTGSSISSATGILKSYVLSAAQTKFDLLIFNVQGALSDTSGTANTFKLEVPGSYAETLISHSNPDGSTHTIGCSAMRILVAGTDYTKGVVGSFNIVGSSGGDSISYSESYILGIGSS